jgi:lysyl-tRNA synthetase class 2
LIQPTILYDFPTDISPLSKCREDDPSLVERFEVFAAGMELGNAFSELNDPAEQERRFRQQVERGGEEVPREVDMDYVGALAHGMAPAAGGGISHASYRLPFDPRSHLVPAAAARRLAAGGLRGGVRPRR